MSRAGGIPIAWTTHARATQCTATILGFILNSLVARGQIFALRACDEA